VIYIYNFLYQAAASMQQLNILHILVNHSYLRNGTILSIYWTYWIFQSHPTCGNGESRCDLQTNKHYSTL